MTLFNWFGVAITPTETKTKEAPPAPPRKRIEPKFREPRPPRRRLRITLLTLLVLGGVALVAGIAITAAVLVGRVDIPTEPTVSVPGVLPPVDGNGDTPIVPATSSTTSTTTATTVPPTTTVEPSIIPDNGLQCFVVPDKYCSLAQIQYDDDGNPIAIYWTPGDLPEGTSVYAPCTGEMLRPGEYEEGVLHIPFYMWSEELEQTVGLYVWFENAHSAVFETDDFGVYEVDGGEFLTTVTSEVINEETGANLMVTSSEPWTTGTLIKNTDI